MKFLIILLLIFYLIVNFINTKKFEKYSNIYTKYQYDLIKKQPVNKIKYSTSKIIDEYNKSNSSLVLFEIKNNKIRIKDKKNINYYIHKSRINFLLSLFQETLKIYKLKEIIFIVNISDNIPTLNIPFLGSVYEKNNNCISIPINWCHYFGTKEKLFIPSEYDNRINNYKNESFSKKKMTSKIVFRGTNNCNIRRKLAFLNNKFKDFMDFKLVKGKKDKNFIDNKIIRQKYDKFFCVRGRGKWTGSLNQFALANGVLFIIEEESKQPFELLLEPNIDYISIKNDLSDFEEKIKISKNKELMSKIRENQNKKTNFFYSKNIMEYIYLCINNLYIY